MVKGAVLLTLLVASACARPRAEWAAARLKWGEAAVTANATSFAMIGDDLYLGDAQSGRVLQLTRDAASRWQERNAFGRRGHGPGEFAVPFTIAAMPRTRELLVLDQAARLQRFSSTGVLVEHNKIELPCRLGISQLAVADTAVFVTGRCNRINGHDSDTVYMVLWRVRTNGTLEAVRWQPLYSRDGRWGTLYTAVKPTAEAGAELLFGAGVTPCIERVGDTHTAPSACPQLERFSAPAPRRFNRRAADRSARWPSPLPAFIGIAAGAGNVVMARPFSAESLLIQTVEPLSVTHIAPIEPFVGCRDGACLWWEPSATGSRIALLRFNQRDW